MQPKSRELEKALVPFSKGPRMCLGIKFVLMLTATVLIRLTCYSLAWCELYLIFGNIFRRLDMEIHNTTYVCSPFAFPLIRLIDHVESKISGDSKIFSSPFIREDNSTSWQRTRQFDSVNFT